MIQRSLAIVATCGALLISGSAAFAQSAPNAAIAAPTPPAAPASAHRHRRNKLRAALHELDLSADQKTQIAGDMKAFHDSKRSGTPETRAELTSKIESTLTPDQRSRFKSAMAKPATAPPAATAPQ